jgi:HSP20 family molecular chaperone IbpA
MRFLLQNRSGSEGCALRHVPEASHGTFLLGSSLSRLIDELSSGFDGVGFDRATSFGRTDVYEKDKQLVFETELPGARKEDVDVRIEGDQLVISGEVKRREDVGRDQYFRVDRRVGRFQRSFPLPAELIDKGKVAARFEDGILRVSAPLRESIKEPEKAVEIKVE